jgi:predicted MarR family transcription regulator
MSELLDKRWHLAETPEEIEITEFELSLWRVFYGFQRWQEDCENSANNTTLTGDELAILHIIRMRNRPKTSYEVARLLNREDIHNIKYSIRKLEKLDLIRRIKSKDKTSAYEITEAGIKDTDTYILARRAMLIALYKKETGLHLEEITHTLNKLKALYDEAGRVAASYKNMGDNKIGS